MPFSFVIESGPRAGLRLPLQRHAAVVLGRGSDADLHMPDEDRFISRHHARVEVQPDGVYLHDLAGRKSTSVNGMAVRWARLAPGNVVRLGNTLLRLVYEGQDAPAVPEGANDVSLYEVVDASIYERCRLPSGAARRLATLDPPEPQPEPVESGRFEDALSCDGCGVAGSPPPSPDLWDAGWLCPACQQSRRRPEAGLPERVGRFDVLAALDRGAMGLLLEAASPDGIHVVIKMLRADQDAHKGLERFLREQRLVTALRHPNIVRCYEVGSHEGRPYIVSEFVGGGTARDLPTLQPAVEDALWLGADLFRALGYAHDLGVVHRDVSPSNLLLTGRDLRAGVRAKLGDFGLAKNRMDLRGMKITLAGEAAGSTLTMSPEQLRSFSDAGPAADLYSAAATVFWMLTSDTPLVLPCPFGDAPVHLQTEAILKPERRSLAQLRPDVPQPVCDLIDRLLAYDPAARNAMHAKDVAAALAELADRTARVNQPGVATREAPQRLLDTAQHPEVPDRFAVALAALEHCIHLLECHRQQAAADVRAAMEAQDPGHTERAVLRHRRLQEDVESAVARWEELVSSS